MSVAPQPFYRGNPNDGTAISGSVEAVGTTDLLAQVPGYKKWRIEEITVCNMTQITGYYTVAIFREYDPNNPLVKITTSTFQPAMGTVDTNVPPRSTAGGPGYFALGVYLAYSQPIPPATTLTLPIVAWALGLEKLWGGVYPGYNAFTGAGGVSLTISGREYRG